MSMEKAEKILALSLLVVLMFSFLAGVVSAEKESFLFENKYYKTWVKGDFSDANLTTETLKLLILVLIVVLIYSALSYASFPENIFIRILLAVIGGFLSTFLIGRKEIITTINSYSALGLALLIFFPIMILVFLSIVSAKKGDPFGIFFQRLLWLAYSLFLFLKVGVLALLKWSVSRSEVAEMTIEKFVQTENFATNHKILNFLIGGKESAQSLQGLAGATDNITLVVLLAVAIGVFVIGVLSNKPIMHWFAKGAIESEKEAQEATIKRSKAYDEARAKAMQEQ